ncbi:MAG TPA: amidohydrolase family protein [Vicinamibacterales bacterium]|nr:amidohydrolase family protein [Vicinamibacterales bacterium]
MPNRKPTASILAVVLALAAANAPDAPSAVDAQGASRRTLFDGARVIVGDGQPAIERAALLVENGTISRVGPRGFEVPPGTERVDLSGKTVIPGIVTLHGHVGYLKDVTFSADNYTRDNLVDQLTRYLYYGVAAVMSMGTDPGDLPYQLRDEPHPGALFRTAGRGLAAPNASTGNLAMRNVAYGVATEAEARRDVRELAAKKPDFVKIWVDDRNGAVQKLSPALYRVIIDEAHAQGLRVAAHVYYLADARDLVEAGVDGFLHLTRDEEMDDALVRRMRERQVFVTPNLGTSEAGTYTGKPSWLDDPVLAETAGPAVLQKASAVYAARQSSDQAPRKSAAVSYAKQQRSLARLNAAGVPIALGGDTGIENTFVGYGEHRELQLMAAAGMTPMQVIVAATRTPSSILRLDGLGTLAPGKGADFIVLDANPLDDISNTRRISKVYQRGVEVDRAALRARWTATR